MNDEPSSTGPGAVGRRELVALAGLFAGPLLALAIYYLIPAHPEAGTDPALALGQAGRATAALSVWMAAWWMTEAIPIYATALLPLVYLPVTGARTMHEAASPYGHELIFLFLGGFVIALAMQRWSLHRRVALVTLSRVGSSPSRMVGAFMVVTAALSMWVSNTATAIMMLPIADSVVESAGDAAKEDRDRFAVALLLGIAYAASIGGIGTLIGTPPNLFLASWAQRELGTPIGFARWMGVGLPVVICMLPAAWWLLAHVLYPVKGARLFSGVELARRSLAELGPPSRAERIVAAVFVLTVATWITLPWLQKIELAGVHPLGGLTDAGVAIGAALSLFVIPVSWRRQVYAMNWETARQLPWGVLILFGGGLSLADALSANGVSDWIGHHVGGLAGAPAIAIVTVVAALVIFLTELTSNTATTAALVPILAGMAPGLGLPPLELAVPAALAASCAFMLPVATPPNAIVFGSGRLTIPQMCRAGFWLNLVGIAVITAVTYAIAWRWLAASA